MQERDISRADVKNGIASGEIIEEYPDDYPHPSCLIFGYTVNSRILYIVAGCDNINLYITAGFTGHEIVPVNQALLVFKPQFYQ